MSDGPGVKVGSSSRKRSKKKRRSNDQKQRDKRMANLIYEAKWLIGAAVVAIPLLVGVIYLVE